jgi:hypothetical protein
MTLYTNELKEISKCRSCHEILIPRDHVPGSDRFAEKQRCDRIKNAAKYTGSTFPCPHMLCPTVVKVPKKKVSVMSCPECNKLICDPHLHVPGSKEAASSEAEDAAAFAEFARQIEEENADYRRWMQDDSDDDDDDDDDDDVDAMFDSAFKEASETATKLENELEKARHFFRERLDQFAEGEFDDATAAEHLALFLHHYSEGKKSGDRDQFTREQVLKIQAKIVSSDCTGSSAANEMCYCPSCEQWKADLAR